jgi:hypothetical protein
MDRAVLDNHGLDFLRKIQVSENKKSHPREVEKG